MAEVFISYADENRCIAEQLGNEIGRSGYSTWLYHRDLIPGLLHLETTRREIEAASVVIVLVSRASLHSDFVFPEMLQAVALRKHLLPVLIDLTHRDLEGEKPKWATAIGFSVAVSWGDGIAATAKITKGLELLIRGQPVGDYTGANDRRKKAVVPVPVPQPFHTHVLRDGGYQFDN